MSPVRLARKALTISFRSFIDTSRPETLQPSEGLCRLAASRSMPALKSSCFYGPTDYPFFQALRTSFAWPLLNIPRRFLRIAPTAARPFLEAVSWSFLSREDTNYTYPNSARSLDYLAHTIAAAIAVPAHEARAYMDEAQNDERLKRHVLEGIKNGPYRSYADLRCEFGRRLGWYWIARILKPRLIVETGVDKGFGSVLLCAALVRNGSGRYIGTDINPRSGFLLRPPYSSVGEVLHGDSVASLRTLREPIDLFINDSDHSPNYELLEYQTIEPKLSAQAIVLGDNAHAASTLMVWSEKTERNFLFWKEDPVRHWYPGGGIGISYKKKCDQNDPKLAPLRRSHVMPSPGDDIHITRNS